MSYISSNEKDFDTEMRDKGIVSRGLTRPKAQKWINVVHRREQLDGG